MIDSAPKGEMNEILLIFTPNIENMQNNQVFRTKHSSTFTGGIPGVLRVPAVDFGLAFFHA